MKTRTQPQIILGLVMPLVTLVTGLGFFFMNYSMLPNRITIHFNTSRVPTTSLPIQEFTILMTTVLLITASICSLVAFSKNKLIVKQHKNIASYGGFFAAVTATMLVGASIIHKRLDNWQDATGPGWFIVIPIILGFAFAFIAARLAAIIHASNLDKTKKQQ